MRSQGLRTQGTIIGPNVNRDWTLEDIFNTNFLVDFAQELAIVTVEKCVIVYPHPHRPNLFILGIPPTTVLPFSTLVSSAVISRRHPLTAMSAGGTIRQPQEMLPMYLTHATGVNLVQQYLNGAQIAHNAGKPFMMFETNTASCGGFSGISDAFVAALWGLDYGLTMAYSNFTGALWHIGGQNVYYNPFTPPPSNQTAFRQWTVGECA